MIEITAKNNINLPTNFILPARSMRRMADAISKDIKYHIRIRTKVTGQDQTLNAPSTLRRKRKQGKLPWPLIDTGKLFLRANHKIKASPGFAKISLVGRAREIAAILSKPDSRPGHRSRVYDKHFGVSRRAEHTVMNIFERDIKAMTDTQVRRGKRS